MQCDEFEVRVNQLLDERRVPHVEQDIADHVGACQACADVLASYQQVLDAVDSTPPLEMDADPAEAIVARVQLAARRRRRFWATLVPLTVAASLLIALAPLLKMRLDEATVADTPPSKSTETLVAHGTSAEKSTSLADSPEGKQPTDLQRVAQGVGEIWDGVKKRITAADKDDTTPLGDAGDPDSDQRKWVDSLKPLAESMVAALSAMRRTLPDTSGEEPPSS